MSEVKGDSTEMYVNVMTSKGSFFAYEWKNALFTRIHRRLFIPLWNPIGSHEISNLCQLTSVTKKNERERERLHKTMSTTYIVNQCILTSINAMWIIWKSHICPNSYSMFKNENYALDLPFSTTAVGNIFNGQIHQILYFIHHNTKRKQTPSLYCN